MVTVIQLTWGNPSRAINIWRISPVSVFLSSFWVDLWVNDLLLFFIFSVRFNVVKRVCSRLFDLSIICWEKGEPDDKLPVAEFYQFPNLRQNHFSVHVSGGKVCRRLWLRTSSNCLQQIKCFFRIGSEIDSGMSRNSSDSIGMNFNPILSTGKLLLHDYRINYLVLTNDNPLGWSNQTSYFTL